MKFGAEEMMTNIKQTTFLSSIAQIKQTYAQRGFNVFIMLLDNQF